MKLGASTLDEVQAIARKILSEAVSCFDDEDTLVVEKELDQVSIRYCSVQASAGKEATCLRLSLRCDGSEMWIRDVHVAASFRSAGLGRQLVRAAEGIAGELEIEVVSAYPLGSSGSFWQKMGYRRHRSTARALSKSVR